MVTRQFKQQNVQFSEILSSYILENLPKNGRQNEREDSIIDSNTPLHLVKELNQS